MTTREALHRLVDDLSEEELREVQDLVELRRVRYEQGITLAHNPAAQGRSVADALEPSFRRLVELARLESDWDGEGGDPPTAPAIAAAADLLAVLAAPPLPLHPDAASPFAVSPLGHGGVQIEWRRPDRYLEIEIGPGGELGYLKVFGEGAERTAQEADGVTRVEMLQQLLEVLRANETS